MEGGLLSTYENRPHARRKRKNRGRSHAQRASSARSAANRERIAVFPQEPWRRRRENSRSADDAGERDKFPQEGPETRAARRTSRLRITFCARLVPVQAHPLGHDANALKLLCSWPAPTPSLLEIPDVRFQRLCNHLVSALRGVLVPGVDELPPLLRGHAPVIWKNVGDSHLVAIGKFGEAPLDVFRGECLVDVREQGGRTYEHRARGCPDPVFKHPLHQQPCRALWILVGLRVADVANPPHCPRETREAAIQHARISPQRTAGRAPVVRNGAPRCRRARHVVEHGLPPFEEVIRLCSLNK